MKLSLDETVFRLKEKYDGRRGVVSVATAGEENTISIKVKRSVRGLSYEKLRLDIMIDFAACENYDEVKVDFDYENTKNLFKN